MQTRHLSGLVVALFVITATSVAQTPAIKTIKPGVLMVAVDNDMPYCQEEKGRIIGIDGEIITAIAEKLGLKVEPVVLDWEGEIQAVQVGRVGHKNSE